MRLAPGYLLLGLSVSFLPSSCGGHGSSSSQIPTSYTLTVSPQPATVEVNSSVTFTAATNSPNVDWVLVGTGGTVTIPPTNAGSLTGQTGANTVVYTAPATPPIYGTGDETAGTVTLRALTAFASDGATDVETTFTITAPSITTGFYAPVSTSVALGSSLLINAYAVGSANNAIAMQVNGVTGGNTSVGTIVAPTNTVYGEYTYTAPTAMPNTGDTITLTVISQADPTKSSNLVLTLQ